MVSLNGLNDTVRHFLILKLPRGAIFGGPKYFREPTDCMAECAEPHAIDCSRVVRLDLPPAQKLVKGLHEAVSPSRLRHEIMIAL